MSSRRRYVFDTNTMISAFLFEEGTTGRALKLALETGQVLLSLELAEELAEVLHRKKFDRYLRQELREEFLAGIIRESTLVRVDVIIRECRDPRDDKFLELAVSGKASHLVTGDRDLLALHPFRGISILTPREFLDHNLQKP
jgi:putative PIN family toxin of toxin-antitoxin system